MLPFKDLRLSLLGLNFPLLSRIIIPSEIQPDFCNPRCPGQETDASTVALGEPSETDLRKHKADEYNLNCVCRAYVEQKK
jgi:hypothetical protein